jgi:hypothetical protein
MKALKAIILALLMLLPMAAVGQTAAQVPSTGLFIDRADQESWYTTVQGVLDVPGEMPLFPYWHGAVKIGLSKFGETVNPFPVVDGVSNGVGFQYTGIDGVVYDPIVNPDININKVVAGWKLIVTYKASAQNYRTIWAYAKFSDLVKAGSPIPGTTGDCFAATGDETGTIPSPVGWIVCPYDKIGNQAYAMPDSAVLTPNGGRKTNGIVETAPLRPMYDGPRRMIYVSESMIYDYWLAQQEGFPYTEYPVAKLVLTFDFNKDTKELTIIKDVKLELPSKYGLTITAQECHDHSLAIAGAAYESGFVNSKSNEKGLACFELDNNEELDQGNALPSTSVKGYAHFYTMNYTGKTLDESLVTEKILTDGTRYVNTTASNKEEYHWDACMAVTRTNDNCRPNDRYAVAQMINQDMTFVVKKAFWPHPDWWTVDAFVQGQIFNKLEGLRMNDMADEPEVVGTAAQWNFILNGELNSPIGDNRQQWRSVETIAVTDLNTADDANIPPGGHTNVLDSELMYFDNMVFNPWDLNDAVHKQYSRLVQFEDGGTATVTLDNTPITVTDADWGAYASFSERVLLIEGNSEVLLHRPSDYTISGKVITFTVTPPYYATVKILYSTRTVHEKMDDKLTAIAGDIVPLELGPADDVKFVMNKTATGWAQLTEPTHYVCLNATGDTVACNGGGLLGSIVSVEFLAPVPTEGKIVYNTARGTYEWIIVGRDSNVIDSAGAAHVSEAFDSIKNIDVKMAGLDKQNTQYSPTVPYIQWWYEDSYYRYYRECALPNEEGCRAHLRDDFSTIMPIDSSNIILVGGPIASLSMEMANDWGSLIYRDKHTDFYSPGQWDSTIHTFARDGSAVIGTYMDVDGTVYFYIYGGDAQDTFWATHWFLGQSFTYNNIPYPNGITYLQTENHGVTSLLLNIDYTYPHPPSITIVKRLNTISQKNPEQDP